MGEINMEWKPLKNLLTPDPNRLLPDPNVIGEMRLKKMNKKELIKFIEETYPDDAEIEIEGELEAQPFMMWSKISFISNDYLDLTYFISLIKYSDDE